MLGSTASNAPPHTHTSKACYETKPTSPSSETLDSQTLTRIGASNNTGSGYPSLESEFDRPRYHARAVAGSRSRGPSRARTRAVGACGRGGSGFLRRPYVGFPGPRARTSVGLLLASLMYSVGRGKLLPALTRTYREQTYLEQSPPLSHGLILVPDLCVARAVNVTCIYMEPVLLG